MSRKDRIAMWVASVLPKRIVYWAAFRVIAKAKALDGEWWKWQDGTRLTCVDALARWEPLEADHPTVAAGLSDPPKRRPSYPHDATNVPGDYVLAGDNRWYPHP